MSLLISWYLDNPNSSSLYCPFLKVASEWSNSRTGVEDFSR